jgi:hypothetical protein
MKSQALGKLAHTIYIIFAVLIVVPLIVLWGKTTLVGMIAVVCIVFLPVLALWISLRKHSRNMRRPVTKLKL